MGESLEVRLHEASSRGLTHREFLELAMQNELHVRDGRQVSRRIAAACFRNVKHLEDFDFSFNKTIKKNRIFDLATGHFIRDQRDVLWLRPPGTEKLAAHWESRGRQSRRHLDDNHQHGRPQ